MFCPWAITSRGKGAPLLGALSLLRPSSHGIRSRPVRSCENQRAVRFGSGDCKSPIAIPAIFAALVAEQCSAPGCQLPSNCALPTSLLTGSFSSACAQFICQVGGGFSPRSPVKQDCFLFFIFDFDFDLKFFLSWRIARSRVDMFPPGMGQLEDGGDTRGKSPGSFSRRRSIRGVTAPQDS